MPWKKVRTCDHHPLHVDSTYLSKIIFMSFMSIKDICHISFLEISFISRLGDMPWDPWPGLVVVKRSAVEVAHAH